MSEESDMALVNRIISERGYLVLRTWNTYKPGDRIQAFSVNRGPKSKHRFDQPCTVIAETDWDDLLVEVNMSEEPWNCPIKPVKGEHYYRVITD